MTDTDSTEQEGPRPQFGNESSATEEEGPLEFPRESKRQGKRQGKRKRERDRKPDRDVPVRNLLAMWRRQVPSRKALLPGRKCFLDPESRYWAKASWVKGYEELRWAGSYWYVWGPPLPDTIWLNGKHYRINEFRDRWAMKAAVELVPI